MHMCIALDDESQEIRLMLGDHSSPKLLLDLRRRIIDQRKKRRRNLHPSFLHLSNASLVLSLVTMSSQVIISVGRLGVSAAVRTEGEDDGGERGKTLGRRMS